MAMNILFSCIFTYLFFAIVGIQPRILLRRSKYSITGLHLQSPCVRFND